MPERIMKAIAYPTTMFWAPFAPAAISMLVNGFCMIYGFVLFKINPLFFIASIFGCHMFLAAQGARFPHMTTLLRAWAVSLTKTKNIYPTKNRKYVP